MTAEAQRLRAAGRHLKRGLLLYGPPGTGKTYTVQYLCSQMPDRTTIVISGQAMGSLGQAAAIARTLQPSMLVLEDVDLVAMERTLPGMESNPLLFQLLNEMDGLEEDADIVFVLTTNRVELLEPALAARPGRIAPGGRDPPAGPRSPPPIAGEVPAGCHRRSDRARGHGDAHRRRERGVPEGARPTGDPGDGGRGRRGPLQVDPSDLDAALRDMLQHGTPILRRILGAGDGDSVSAGTGDGQA